MSDPNLIQHEKVMAVVLSNQGSDSGETVEAIHDHINSLRTELFEKLHNCGLRNVDEITLKFSFRFGGPK